MNHGFQRFLQTWFDSKPGQVVFKQEKKLLEKVLPNKFGYYLVQLGCVSKSSLFQSSRISQKILIDSRAKFCLPQELADEHVQMVLSDFDFLPLSRDSIDLVLLPHSLETVDDPHYLLRQVDNMLLGEGYVVITGFNPAGCLPFRFKFLARDFGFSKAKHHRASKVREWLRVLGFEVEETHYTSVMCFSSNEKYKRWAGFIEKIERFLQWFGFEFGNVYCIVAKKKVDAPTLVGMKWHLPRWKKARNGSVASQRLKNQRTQSD